MRNIGLSMNWVRGASLALMFATAFSRTSAQGIIYGSPQPPAYYAAGIIVSYNLDVNGDGIADFMLISEADSALVQPLGNNSLITIPEPPPDLGYFIAALPSGFTVGSSLDPIYQWYYPNTDQFGMAAIGAQESIDNQVYTIGYFTRLPSAYIGFDLNTGGTNYYGWMQIANPAPVVAGQVIDWAYESDANTPIEAGAVPEPSTWALLAAGTALMIHSRKISFCLIIG
jgi:hypothetical protein